MGDERVCRREDPTTADLEVRKHSGSLNNLGRVNDM